MYDYRIVLFSIFTGLFIFTIIKLYKFYNLFKNENEKCRKLQKDIKFKKKFVNFYFNQINSPMNTIYMAIRLLENKVSDNKRKEIINIIQHSISKTTETLNYLRDLLEFKEGTFELVFDGINFIKVLKMVLLSHKKIIEDKHISIDIVIDRDISNKLIKGDSKKIYQCIDILISNSIKYINKNGIINIKIELKTNTVKIKKENDIDYSPSNKTLIFSVADNGIGIKEDITKYIFADLEEIKDMNDVLPEYFGISLSYLKSIIKFHDGTVSFKSVSNIGANFSFSLPYDYKIISNNPTNTQKIKTTEFFKNNNDIEFSLTKESDEESDEESNEESSEDNLAPNPDLKILYVDDQEDYLDYIVIILEKYGYIIDTAKNGNEAIAKTEKKEYDIIFMDNIMPELGGVEASRYIKKKYPNIEIIGITGINFDEDIKSYNDAGVSQVLIKPVSHQIIKQILFEKK
jgi:CheY-like chemotaxis protein/nitrogen-specific signal transduction histidine kinase